MRLTELQQKVFLDRYALKDAKGDPLETDVEQMWSRVAGLVVKAEKGLEVDWEGYFRDRLLEDFRFIPGGRVLSATQETKTTLFNCFVLPSPEDSRAGIMDTATKMVEIMSRGGGVGVNLSTLRPRGARVVGVNGTSSGAVQWGMVYDSATACVNQGGSRRGALMLVLNVDHPDIVEFIQAKNTPGVLTNCNLSVAITDYFMSAVQKDRDWVLGFGDVYKTVSARWLYNLICENAWRSGEPGVVFFDRINAYNNTYYYDTINCINPCGEMPLPPWGVCNLGSINLTKFVTRGSGKPIQRVNWHNLQDTVRLAVRFLDNVIDVTPYAFQENKDVQQATRRIGLGTMGLADMLIMLKLRYGSPECLNFIDTLYGYIAIEAYKYSAVLAKEKGAFPAFDSALFLGSGFVEQLPSDVIKDIQSVGIRNATLLTQAPTGSTGLLAGVSSGIEPNFAWEYRRKDRLGEHVMHHPLYEDWIHDTNGSVEYIPDYFVTAHEVTPEEHVMMQAAIQRWVDASISKTVNAPKHHTVEDVKNLYMMAYTEGCKGITYYRDGSREGVLIKDQEPEKVEEKKQVNIILATKPVKREVLADSPARRIKIKTGCGDLWLTCVFDEAGDLREVFTVTGHDGGCACNTEALSRMISNSLRYDLPIPEIVKQLGQTKPCRSFDRLKQRDKTVNAKSCPDAIARQLAEYIKAEPEHDDTADAAAQVEQPKQVDIFSIYTATCPECGSKSLEKEEGCQTCHVCGFSKCG